MMKMYWYRFTATITKLQCKQRGQPLLLGKELERYKREYIAELRKTGGIVKAEIVSSAARG